MQHSTPCRDTFKGIACCSDTCPVKQGWLVSKHGDPSPSLDNVSPCCIPPAVIVLSLYQASVSHCSVWLMPLHACHCAPLGRAWLHLLTPSSCKQQADLPEFPPGLTKSLHLTRHWIVSIQKWVCFYSWLEIYRFACPCFHIRVGSFSGLACKTVLCFPKLETLHAGRKPARDASFSVGDSANQPTRSTGHLCERVAPGKCRSWGSFIPKCCLSQNAAGPNSFLCLETCLQLVLPELPRS